MSLKLYMFCRLVLNEMKFTTSGRLARDYVVEALDESCAFDLPTIIECNYIPNKRQEIASPYVAIQYSHLVDIAPNIPEIDEHAHIDLLIGRDLISVHHVIDQRLGKDHRAQAIHISEDEVQNPTPPKKLKISEVARQAYEEYTKSIERSKKLEAKLDKCMDKLLNSD
ncbi:Hypothetical predicted protein [Mytilus galloprovincialis]|uniref:Uncharacterized protein n=1 Tax=Mytilus galloprovincialis TaxID=29158 RepID=A0A8B6E3F4_MYTGA|nr:Hypothetical predicted protein [Mytilus galloprovincialis]